MTLAYNRRRKGLRGRAISCDPYLVPDDEYHLTPEDARELWEDLRVAEAIDPDRPFPQAEKILDATRSFLEDD